MVGVFRDFALEWQEIPQGERNYAWRAIVIGCKEVDFYISKLLSKTVSGITKASSLHVLISRQDTQQTLSLGLLQLFDHSLI